MIAYPPIFYDQRPIFCSKGKNIDDVSVKSQKRSHLNLFFLNKILDKIMTQNNKYLVSEIISLLITNVVLFI